MGKRITMAMIADACRTSIGTVDRALHNRADINPETRRMILETAERLGYKTNQLAGALSRRSTIRLACIDLNEPEVFFGYIHSGVQRAAEELAPYGIEVDLLYYDAHTPDSQQQLLASLDCAQYDGIAINPQSVACAAYIDRFSAAGIPTVTFNNDLPNSARLFYVGVDSEQSGRMAGDIMGTLLNGRGAVTIMGNFNQAIPFVERFQGFCDVIHRHYPEISVYPSADCKLDMTLTRRNLSNLFASVPDIRGIFCTNYVSTVGAIRALRELGPKNVALIGYDISQDGIQAVKDGTCQCLLYQDPYQQGYQAIRLLAKHILESWTPETDKILLETRLAFRQNIENYSSGILRWDRSLF